jgi:hypothetical protein
MPGCNAINEHALTTQHQIFRDDIAIRKDCSLALMYNAAYHVQRQIGSTQTISSTPSQHHNG